MIIRAGCIWSDFTHTRQGGDEVMPKKRVSKVIKMFVSWIHVVSYLRGVFVKLKVISDTLSGIGFSLANGLVTWNHASHGRARNKVFSISNISRPRCLSRTRSAPCCTLVLACEKTITHMRKNSHHHHLEVACIEEH